MFSLHQRTALVTGAGSGIGAAIAELFAQAGGFVFVADVQPKLGQETEARIRQKGGQAQFLSCDVSSEAEAQRAANFVQEQGRSLDILVNNAGIGHVGTILETTAADLDRLHSVNVRGVFNLSKAFLPSMLRQQRGNIINMASIGGVVGIRDRLAYCASKFAVVGLTKAMALDHAKQGIRVNCICPGRVETPFVAARLKEYPDPQKAYAEMAATQALRRMGTPNEIAAAALYLASDESAFVTGTEFIIDGGWSAGK